MLEVLKPYILYAKITLIVVAIGAATYFINDYRDMRREMREQKAQLSTVDSQFKQIGEGYQTLNSIIKNNQDANNKAIMLLGDQTVRYMNASNAQIQSLYTAIGKINSNIMDLTKVIGGNRDSNGVVSDVKLSQERPNNAPSLTTLNLKYDPSKPLGQAFAGSKWQNNTEVFKPSFGQWQLKDGGYRVATRLQREVYDAQGNKIGSEEVPMEKAEAEFTPSAFGLGPQVPRFTVTPLISYDSVDKKFRPGVLGDYRMTNSFGVSGGIVNNSSVLGFSYRFGIK